jgi:error-prone DNA polymerase
MLPAYAELHCLTNFSFLRGASHPEELVERAQALGYAALAVTDECSLSGAVRAHVAAKSAGLPLVIGTEVTLADGVKLVLYATDRASYGNLSQLITRGRRSAVKGSYTLRGDDVSAFAGGLLALWMPKIGSETNFRGADAVADAPAEKSSQTSLAVARWVAATFAGRAWIAVELLARAGDRAKLAQCAELSLATGLPQVAAGDVHMHVRARRTLQDTMTAIRLRKPIAECGHALHPNGERHLRSRARLASIYPPELLAETVAIAQRCRFSLDELRYEYPEEIVPAGQTPASYLAAAHGCGPCAALREGGLPARRARADRARARADRRASLRALLPDGARHRRVRPLARDPVPGTRLGGKLGRLLRTRHHRGRSFADEHVVRALPVEGAQRAARHRRRLRAPAARGSDAVRLRKIWPRPRGARGDAHHLRPKSAVRDVGRALGLEPAQVDRLSGILAWWDGREIKTERIREAGFEPDNPVLVRLMALTGELIGFPRHLSQHVGGFVIARDLVERMVPVENAAMADRTVLQWDKDDLDALGLLKVDCLALGMLSAIRRALEMVWKTGSGPLFDLRRVKCATHADGKMDLAPFTMQDIPAEDPEVTRCASAPTRSACSRSNRARSNRCCRG